MIKVKVLELAYYNNRLIKAGEIIDYKGKKLPRWATLADGIETEKGSKKVVNVPPEKPKDKANDARTDMQEEVILETPEVEKEAVLTKDEFNVPDIANLEYLELLINEGIEKNIIIEDADKKTVEAQIAELEKALDKKGN